MEHLTDELLHALRSGGLEPAISNHWRAHCVVCAGCFARLKSDRRSTPIDWPNPSGRRLERGVMIGRYEIIRALGEGGEAAVYEANDPVLERRVALKLLHPGSDSAQQGRRARLLREARSMARLSHPAVLTIYDVSESDGGFITMELVDGVTLRPWLMAGKRSLIDVLDVCCQMGEGLASAHRAGIVHRDFQPDNVLVDVTGRARVTDFGLARRRGDAAPSDDGLKAYRSPEQQLGRAGDHLSDQYSFCLTAAEALETVGQRFPSWLKSALERGIHQLPEARFESMQQLLGVLQLRLLRLRAA